KRDGTAGRARRDFHLWSAARPGAAVLSIAPFAATESGAAEAWDRFVATTWNGTFMHTRRFLAYHGPRFVDASVPVPDRDGALAPVLPAAVDPGDSERVASHPGTTYAGLAYGPELRGERMLEALTLIREHYRDRGFAAVRYRTVPFIYHRVPAADDVYALFR